MANMGPRQLKSSVSNISTIIEESGLSTHVDGSKLDQKDESNFCPLCRRESSLQPSSSSPDNKKNVNGDGSDRSSSPPSAVPASPLPEWLERLESTWGTKLILPEWEELEEHIDHRASNGWMGHDLIHNARAPVRITRYHWKTSGKGGGGRGGDISSDADEEEVVDEGTKGTKTKTTTEGGEEESPPHKCVGTTLTGLVQFTRYAESHKGYCHGGSICSVMDDVLGYCGFLCTGVIRPWCGFTAQVNTSLKRPVTVGSYLVARAEIVKRDGRKVYLKSELFDPSSSSSSPVVGDNDGGITGEVPVVHATAEGLFVLTREAAKQEEEEEKAASES